MKKILLFMFLGFLSLFAGDLNSSIVVPHVEYANPDGMTEKYKIGSIAVVGKPSKAHVDDKGGIYQIFSYKSGHFDINKSKKTELFFGKRSEYDNFMKENLVANIADGSLRMLSNSSNAIATGTANIGANLGVGAGLGVFTTLLTMSVDTLSKDYEYMKVVSYVDENGNKGKITSIYVSNHNKYSDDEIRSIMAKKESNL